MEVNEKWEPRTVQEAQGSGEWEKWKFAMKEEYQSLIDNKTWTLTDFSQGRRAI
jgi:hypothetical protein